MCEKRLTKNFEKEETMGDSCGSDGRPIIKRKLTGCKMD